MSVLDRSELEASPLADLHAIASELGLDGFRRLRKADLIDHIVARQNGEEPPEVKAAPAAAEKPEAASASEDADDDDEPRSRPRRRGGRGRGRARSEGDREPREPRAKAEAPARDADDSGAPEKDAPEAGVEGVVELLNNGSGFVRVSPPEPSDHDVYISAAQVRRCELISGDRVSGPVRGPRRSERYPSLVRVDTINGAPADEVAEGTRYDELPAGFPTERLALGGEDPTVKAVEWLTPFGKGSRVTIVGAPRAGKSEALRRVAGALAGTDGLEISVVLAGVRPEEISEWTTGPVPPTSAVSFASSADAQSEAVEQAVEQARRVAARGGDALVLIDTLDGVNPVTARRTLAAARNVVDGGSLTIVATASGALGGETTVIALDPRLTAARRFPAIDLSVSGALRPELLVGEAGAEAIAKARLDAFG